MSRCDSCILGNQECFDVTISITKWKKSTMLKFPDAVRHAQPTRYALIPSRYHADKKSWACTEDRYLGRKESGSP